MSEEWYPIIKYVVGVDNDTLDTLSKLGMKTLGSNSIVWEMIFPKLIYSDRKKKENDKIVCMQMCNIMSEDGFQFDDENLYPMAVEKDIANNKFSLGVYIHTIKQH